jgi:phage terminase large subunit-like protein
VWIPHPKQFPWVEDFISELTMFPKANYDDQVDAMTQAIMRLKASRAVALVRGVFDNLRKVADWN